MITNDSAIKFVSGIMKRGHESVIEHEKVSVRVVCDRGVSHEIVRHRLASYSQESTRYCDYDKGEITFIQPCWFTNDCTGLSPDDFDTVIIGTGIGRINPHPEADWINAMHYIEGTYKDLREAGWKPEQARSVLPNSLKTEIVMTMNLREWRHFFKLRTAKAAHPQIREIAIPMLAEFKKLIPIIFDDIEVID
jgi:thymidylate synthase (FAD)